MNDTSTANPPALNVDTRSVLLVSILASSMAFIDGTALNVTLPVLQADLGATGSQLLWILNAYLLMLAALILIGGALGDRVGRKKVFAAGIVLFIASSLLCGLAASTGLLIVSRVFQGMGGALMIPGSLAILSANFPSHLRGRAIGTWSAATTVVMIAGPVLGGLLADLGLWRAVFLINLPIGLLALVLLITRVPESRAETTVGSLDIPGALLVSLGLAGITYGLLSAPDLGLSNPQVFLTLAGGCLALMIFVLVEKRTKNPMLPLHLFQSRLFTGANLLTLFLYGALSVALLFYSLNLVQAQNYSPSLAGLAYLPFVALLALLSRWAGGLVDRVGPRLPLIVGPALAGLGFLLLALPGQTAGPAQFWTTFFPGIAVFGIGMGITVAPLTTTVMSALPVHYSGTASGVNNAVSRVAGVIAIAILGALALSLFQTNLASRSAALNLPAPLQQTLLAGANRLGDTPVPPGLSTAEARSVQAAIQQSFIATYRIVLGICAALAWISSLMSAWFIGGLAKSSQAET